MKEATQEKTGTSLVEYGGVNTWNVQISREELSKMLGGEVTEETEFIFGQPDKEFIL